MLPMTMGWSSPTQSPDIMHPFVYSIDGYLDLIVYQRYYTEPPYCTMMNNPTPNLT